jgi:hypothetical protein
MLLLNLLSTKSNASNDVTDYGRIQTYLAFAVFPQLLLSDGTRLGPKALRRGRPHTASLLRKGVSALVEREISSIRSAGLTCSDGCRAVQPQSLSVHEPGNHPNLESEVPKILGVKGMSHAGRADLEELKILIERDLKMIFPGADRLAVGICAQSWQADEYTQSAYALYRPGQ